MGFRAMYGSQRSHNPWLKCHENEENIENDYVMRNDHGIKTTEPILMIFVSFFSEDNFFSDEIKNAIFSNIKVTQIERSAFFDTRYTCRTLFHKGHGWWYFLCMHLLLVVDLKLIFYVFKGSKICDIQGGSGGEEGSSVPPQPPPHPLHLGGWR